MLLARSVLAVALQAGLALTFLIGGADHPWRVAADWWLGTLTVVNVVVLLLLRRLLAAEGRRLRDLYRIRREQLRPDLPWLLAALFLLGPIGFVPNLLLGDALWGSAQQGADLSFRALPIWGAVTIMVTFPLLQGAAELPTYFGYVMPRLRSLYGWGPRALLVAALMLSATTEYPPLSGDGPRTD
ncbi:MAG TPA: hypothetical protein VK838_02890 [Candidatus Limnocylindrales bacterium]|nr:hypothetical protein [Candidatus Limnocylindrales bacterium]